MRFNKRQLFIVPLILAAGILLGMQINGAVSGDDTYEQLDKLEQAFSIIVKRYVDPVKVSNLTENGIEGMLKTLDPHSVYIDKDRMKDVKERFNASFEGIGIYYEVVKDTIRVISPITGGPSEEAGLVAGDRIIEVNDSSAIGFSAEEVQDNLKGPKGTDVDITVLRPGYSDTLQFTITRDEIPLHTLDAAYMLDERTGYIRLNRFARTTYREFKDAMDRLEDQGMERLMLDLRRNAGGYMQMAIKVANEFLEDGETIVYTKSRHPDFNERYEANAQGLFKKGPVIVLVNQQTASASEIVSGALQDHDRGLIVGRRTFGKGLVQQQFELNDGSVIQMTISRYYTPAGRLIQTPYAGEDREEYYSEKFERQVTNAMVDAREYTKNVPDSLVYRTDHGRKVYGGGGILPDYIVPRDSATALQQALVRKRIMRGFVSHWIDQHGLDLESEWEGRKEEYLDSYQIDGNMWGAVVDYMESQGITFVDGKAGMPDSVDMSSDQRWVFTQQELGNDERYIKVTLKARFARRIWGVSDPMWWKIQNQLDHDIQRALELWNQAEKLLATYQEPVTY